MRSVRAKAPLRMSFAGGGTDVPPYPAERGGLVLNATIDKHAYATLRPRTDDEINVRSLDYDIVAKYQVDQELLYDGKLDLVKAVINAMDARGGFDLFLHSDAPPGSGLGSSSAMVVALIGAFKEWLDLPMTEYEIAELAHRIEREDLGIVGGMQDQYAATFGGFNFIEFMADAVVVNPLRIKRSVENELAYRLLLAYTGVTRLSGKIVERQMEAYRDGVRPVVDAFARLKDVTGEMKSALLRGRLDDFGRLLGEAWTAKQNFAPGVTSPEIDALYAAAREHGATGGKILGAGGGGYLLVYCEFGTKHRVAERLEAAGAQLVPFCFSHAGLESWRVR